MGVKQISRKTVKWDNVLKGGPSKICGRQPLKNLKWNFKFFKGCLPQILLGPLLNILSQMIGLLVVLLLTFSRAKYCVRVSVTLLIQQKKKKIREKKRWYTWHQQACVQTKPEGIIHKMETNSHDNDKAVERIKNFDQEIKDAGLSASVFKKSLTKFVRTFNSF